jgi:CheY-like chemotaxis protein
VILYDMLMPGMDGMTVIREVHAKRPDQLIFLTATRIGNGLSRCERRCVYQETL